MRWGNYSEQLYIRIGTISLIISHSPPTGYLNPFQPSPNPKTFITVLFTLHRHIAPHSRTTNNTTLTHSHTPTAVMPK